MPTAVTATMAYKGHSNIQNTAKYGKQTGDRFWMDTAGVVWAAIVLVAIPSLGIAAAPWLLYPITKLVGVAAYLYLLPL